MATYKFTRVYKVEAATKAEAMEKMRQNPAEYLSYEAAALVATEKNGFVSVFRRQVTGR